MKVLFLGGDKRQLEIMKALKNSNYEISALGYDLVDLDETVKRVALDSLEIGRYNIIIFPVSGVKEDYSVVSDFTNDKIVLNSTFLKHVNKKAIIFTGVKSQCLEEMLRYADKDAIALMENEEIKRKNSIPTAEGIIADLVMNTDFTINNSRVLILGHGNVGRQLALKLKALGATVTVGVLNSDEASTIEDYEAILTSDHASMESKLQNSDVIVNTVPKLILDGGFLNCIRKGTYILDISSYPYGIDFKTANELKIKNKLYLGIPGKIAPKTSGQILATEIISTLEGRSVMPKVGLAITSSFCTIPTVLIQIDLLQEKGFEVIPIVSPQVIETDTRFGKGGDIKRILEEKTGHNVVSTIVEAEKFGSIEPLDLLLISPATGNCIAKLANGITDEPVLLAAKATLRNQHPIVLGISTNDGLGTNFKNIGTLYNTKNIFFIPFGQDDPVNKPNSLVAHFNLIMNTIDEALNQRQFQPVLKSHNNQ